MARPREGGRDKFCLAHTGLPDDDITAADEALERHWPRVPYSFENQSPISLKFAKKCSQPSETIRSRARPSK